MATLLPCSSTYRPGNICDKQETKSGGFAATCKLEPARNCDTSMIQGSVMMHSSFKAQYLVNVWPDLFIILHCLFKSLHILLMLCKLGLGIVLVMEILQAASCLPAMQQIVLGLSLHIVWAAQFNTWLLIKLTPKGVVFSFLFFSSLFFSSLFFSFLFFSFLFFSFLFFSFLFFSLCISVQQDDL